MDDMKYIFSKNVRVAQTGQDDEVTGALFIYGTMAEAEIAYHTELAYGLSLNNLVLAHYSVTNEKGNVMFGLERLIDNTELFETVTSKTQDEE